MSAPNDLAVLIERWFTDRLMRHRGVSSNTIASYRDTFRLLFPAWTLQWRPTIDVLDGACKEGGVMPISSKC